MIRIQAESMTVNPKTLLISTAVIRAANLLAARLITSWGLNLNDAEWDKIVLGATRMIEHLKPEDTKVTIELYWKNALFFTNQKSPDTDFANLRKMGLLP